MVRKAARALARHGLVSAYGHCSARLNEAQFLVSPAKAPGCVEAGDPCTTAPINGPLPSGVLGEVRIHQHVYRRRPDIGGVVRFQAPSIMSLSALRLTPRARHGFGAYFAPAPPLWDDPQLIRSEEKASALAGLLDDASAVVMRGNGAVVVGPTLPHALVLAWYLEDAARVELSVLAASRPGTPPAEFSKAESDERATWAGGIAERMWSHLTFGDPE